MRRVTVLLTLAIVVASCSPKEEGTGSVNKCATDLFSSYNPKVMDQCVAVCRKCDHGITSTCTKSCTLKGAH